MIFIFFSSNKEWNQSNQWQSQKTEVQLKQKAFYINDRGCYTFYKLLGFLFTWGTKGEGCRFMEITLQKCCSWEWILQSSWAMRGGENLMPRGLHYNAPSWCRTSKTKIKKKHVVLLILAPIIHSYVCKKGALLLSYLHAYWAVWLMG